MSAQLIERFRKQKAAAITAMEAIQKKSAGGTVELSAADQARFDALTAKAEDLAGTISLIETGGTDCPDNERVEAMVATARKYTPSLPENLSDTFIAERLSIAQIGQRLTDLAAEADSRTPIQQGHHSAGITRDQRDTMRECMSAAIVHRYDPKSFSDLGDQARPYMGLSLVEMAREYLQAAGVNTEGMARHRVAALAMFGSRGGSEFLSGFHTTSDFPNILLDASNKTLRKGYQSAAPSFKAFMHPATAADFKTINRIQISDAPVMLPINEHGEYKRVYLSDSKESYTLGTYGWIIGISRKVIINDDLDALTKIPFQVGQAAARTESNIAWATITANAAMGDGNALFHASHNNLITSNPLGNTGLAKAKAAMRKQTAPKGDKLDLVPAYAIVPADLEHTLLQLLAPTQLYANTSTNVVPEWIKNLAPVVEPRLDDVATIGPTTWYLAANPEAIDTIEYCYLEGEEGVYTEVKNGWEIDGIEIKARLDFAAKAMDWRGIIRCDA